jgi:hypothetical protein
MVRKELLFPQQKPENFWTASSPLHRGGGLTPDGSGGILSELMRMVFLSGALLLAAHLPASALVFWNLGNEANQTDPGTGVPWNSVAKIYDQANDAISGSAVYLGNGYLLTANHVYLGPGHDANNYSHVSFDNINSYAIDPGFGTYGFQVAAGVDMRVIKLTLDPAGVNAVTLLTAPTEQIAPAVLIGWGIGRDPTVPLASTNVAWGSDATATKRWGLNEPKFAGSAPYDYLGTVAGASGPGFVPGGLGYAEASVALYDSGSGLFQEINNVWYLIGITTSTDDGGSTDFGIDSSASAERGDRDYFARISSYDEQITALVPEPSIVSLLALSGAAAAVFAFRRRR